MTIKLSSLVRRQLPEFISTHYSTFASFLEKYYESLEITGQPLDILFNITSYYDINFYEKNLLQKGSNLTSFLSLTDTVIELEDATAFPEEYGYVKIDNEICFYTEKVGNTLTGVYRGVSGNTRLGDLYDKTDFISSSSENHISGSYVQNISNLFLFAILKSFESQYLASIPEKYLNEEIDKRTLIKNITDFYRAKGSEKSIQFIFNSLISKDQREEVSVRRPSELTFRSSNSDWVTSYRIKIDVISGDPKNLIGTELEQSEPYAYGVIENVEATNNSIDLILDPTSVVSEFKYYGYTNLVNSISSTDKENFVLEVDSTGAWKSTDDRLYIGNDTFIIESKNVNQFKIKTRIGSSVFNPGSTVYLQKPFDINGVKFSITGSVYNLKSKSRSPYSSKGDPILVSKSAQQSFDPIVYDSSTSSYRWIPNENRSKPSIPTKLNLQNQLSTVNTNVSSILEDETYFYICSSGYPSFNILSDTLIDQNQNLSENNYLKLIRKNPVFSTEVYTTNSYDVGVLVDGTLIYGKKSDSFVRTGPIVKANIINKGSGYKNPPVVLVNNSPSKASAILSGDVVSDIKINTTQVYKKTPSITITSGRGAVLEAVVTAGKVTSFVIVDPGEYYVSPPRIVIRDSLGRGKFANCRSVISSNGKIVGVEIVDGGKNYTKDNIIVEVIPEGSGALAEVEIKKWFFDRYTEIGSDNIDWNGGSLVNKKFESKRTYAVVSNPKRLRYEINDNLNSILVEQPSGHSKIIGFAYDGYPIYGPYGYEDPLDNQSDVVKMNSGYVLNSNRISGPSISQYPLGSFDEDYTWVPSVESGKTELDQNNGRYCVTPEYPNGTYAYFVTVDSSGDPVYPYIMGKNYYGIPVDSNYNQPITQSEIPRSARILNFSSYTDNGNNFSAVISDVERGSVDGFIIDQANSLHNPGNRLFVDNTNTEGDGLLVSVESVFGKNIEYIKSRESVCILTSVSNVYLFDEYILRERNSLREGSIVGDVLFDNTIVLENLNEKFDGDNLFDLVNPETDEIVKINNLVLGKNSTFTKDATVSLTDGFNRPDSVVATGKVLESTSNQNTLRVLVTSGDFSLGINSDRLFLQSTVSSDDVGVNIVTLNSLSEGIEIFNFNYNFAIVKTSDDHNLSINDSINVSINPDDSITEKTYYVRKRLFQELKLRDLTLNSRLIDTGIGKLSILSGGKFRSSGTFTTTLGNASVVVTITNYGSYNSVSNIEIIDKGSGFVEDQQLRFDSNLVTDPLDSSKQVFLTDFGVYMEKDSVFVSRVDHVGLGITNTELKLSLVENVSENDLLLIGKEIIKVTSVNYADRTITVERGQEGTSADEHFDRAKISFYNFNYRFTKNSFIPELGETELTSPKVYSYDTKTKSLILYYEYGVSPESTTTISLSSFIKDESDGRKNVRISSVGEKLFKLEFSEDDEENFTVNPNINIQNYYKYIFNTKHPSMTSTYLDFSPSLNYNLVTQEKVVGPAEPGTNSDNSFVSLKFGFGPDINTNTYTEKITNRFSNYYYFVVASGVSTDGSKLTLIEDPLTGPKTVKYTTNNKFVYDINTLPQENGSGDMKYTTSSVNAVGVINTLKINNSGKNYVSVPIVRGVESARTLSPTLIPNMNSSGGIDSFTVTNPGFGFVNPKIILEGEGNQGIFSVSLNQNGGVNGVRVLDTGSGYKKIPNVFVVDDTNKIYLTSKTIGVPRTIEILNSGKKFTTDNSTLPIFTSTYVVLLSDVQSSSFGPGKIIRQFDEYNNVIFTGKITKNGYRVGSNIVKFENISGKLSKDLPLNGSKIISILFTDYESEIKSFYNKSGSFISEKGFLSSTNSNLTDSYFYQDYSYIIRSQTPIEIWRSLIKDVVHPAGFQLFGEVVVEADTGFINQPTFQSSTPIVLTINAGVEAAYTINTRTVIKEIVETVSNTNVQRGVGRLNLPEFNEDFNKAKEVYLSPEFDGFIDSDYGSSYGTKIFTILEKGTGAPVFPYDENSIIVSLTGVIQEPKVSYRIQGSQIIFNIAPLGNRVVEGQVLPPDEFIGRVFEYKDPEDNEKYFKKIRNIFQRNGIWLDSANQIRSNKNFIIEETYGYITSKYPLTDFNVDEYKENIGLVVDSFEHDLRFGGNSAVFNMGESYYNIGLPVNFENTDVNVIKETYKYVSKLCAASIRNWDVVFVDDPNTEDPQFEVIVSANSDIITVPNTFGIVEGMYLSSGNQFPLGTRVVEIIDDTNIRVSNNAFSNITDADSFIFEVPIGSVVLPPVGSTEVEFNYNGIIIQTDAELIVSDGVTVSITAAVAKLRQVRFSLSRINPGVFVDAANLINVNREYIIDETIDYINLLFPSFSNPSVKKCRRDLGYLIDAITYHLYYGGNDRIVDYAEKYFIGNKLNYINDQLSESVIAFEYSISLMLEAIQNPGSPFQTLNYPVAPDEANFIDKCAEVKSALNSYKEIYTFILENGTNLIPRDFGNTQKSGYYTNLTTYSNYNIIDDVELQLATEIDGIWFASECAETVSSLYSLFEYLNDILTNGSEDIEISTPDYFDGETKSFELFTDDNNPLKTDDGEDLLVFINGILQRPSSYKIIRSSEELVPDIIEFSEAPRWDQNESQIRLNQGTAVDYFYAFSIGVYERRTIRTKEIQYENEFDIVDYEGSIINPINDSRYHLVFVDGVLQKNGIDYNIKQTRIFFNKKLNYFKPKTGEILYSKVDIISFTGEKNLDTFIGFDFQPGTYGFQITFDLYSNAYEEIKEWDRSSNTHPIDIVDSIGPVGRVVGYSRVNEPYPGVRFTLVTDRNRDNVFDFITLKKDLPVIGTLTYLFANPLFVTVDLVLPGIEQYIYGNVEVSNDQTLTVENGATLIVLNSFSSVNYKLDDEGEKVLERIGNSVSINDDKVLLNKSWRTINRITANLLEGDYIKVDGEKNYREIVKVPDIVKTSQNNLYVPVSKKIYGNITTSVSNERPIGKGLFIDPYLDENGSISFLDYKKPDYIRSELLNINFRPVGNYPREVFVDFLSVDGNGGGGLAKAIIFGNQIISVAILNPGYGYTQPPIPIITRGYDIIKSHRNVSATIQRDLNIDIPLNDFKLFKEIEVFSPRVNNNFNIYIDLQTPDKFRESNVTLFLESQFGGENTIFSIDAIPQEIVRQIPFEIAIDPAAGIVETLWTIPSESSLGIGETQTNTSQITYNFESSVSIGETFRFPETTDLIATLIVIDFLDTDTVLYVTNTDGFDDFGFLQVGTEVVAYTSKESDRFIISERGVFGSEIPEIHPIGTVVTPFLPNVNDLSAEFFYVESDLIVGDQFESTSEFVVLKELEYENTNINIDPAVVNYYLQPELLIKAQFESQLTKTFGSTNDVGISLVTSDSEIYVKVDNSSFAIEDVSVMSVEMIDDVFTSINSGLQKQIEASISDISTSIVISSTDNISSATIQSDPVFDLSIFVNSVPEENLQIEKLNVEQFNLQIQSTQNITELNTATDINIIIQSTSTENALVPNFRDFNVSILLENTSENVELIDDIDVSVVTISSYTTQLSSTLELYNVISDIEYVEEITSIISSEGTITGVSSDSTSEVITLVNRPPSDASLIILENISLSTEITSTPFNIEIEVGSNLAIIQQELRKQPEDLLPEYGDIVTDVEINNQLNLVSYVEVSNTSLNISSIVERAAIDEFNETINVGNIGIN